MKIIYEPRGRAKEYADLACNDYTGCENACAYCFAPSVMRSDRKEYHATVKPRRDAVMKWFEHDCEELQRKGDTRRVHMNFVSDPYPDMEAEIHLTRHCIEAAERHGVGINILTKGKYDVVRPDFNLFRRAGVHFGVTCCFMDDTLRREWEPNASSVPERISLLKQAHAMGIFTWVSMEPVIDPKNALDFFRFMQDARVVDLWKVGRLNYHPHAKTIDWAKFRDDFREIADRNGANYIIKKDLLCADSAERREGV